MRLKFIFFLLGSVFFFKISFSQTFTGDSWQDAKQNKKATIAIVYAETPKFAQMSNGKGSGVCFDIMNDFVKFVKTNYEVELSIQYKSNADPKDFDAFLKTIKRSNGGVFGLGDVTITDQRKKIYNFSPPYFSNVAILITNSSVPTLTDQKNISKEFSNIKAISQKGSTHDKRIQRLKSKYTDLKVEYVKNSQQKLDKILTSSNYFCYMDFPNYLDAMSKKMSVKRHAVGDDRGEEFGFIMPKNSDWSIVMNEFFNANGGYTKSIGYRKILANNLGNNVLKMLDSFKNN